MPETQITETLDSAFSEARIDSGKYLIRGVSILNERSRNNRIYSATALHDVVGLIESGPGKVFLNHSLNETTRDVQDFAGRLTSPQLVGTRVSANLTVMKPLWPLLEALVTQFPESVGFSIDARAKLIPGGAQEGMDLVESVSVLTSTDLVTDPASTSGIFEQITESINNHRRSEEMARDVVASCAEEWLVILGESRDKVKGMSRANLATLIEDHNKKLDSGSHAMMGNVSPSDMKRLRVLDREVWNSMHKREPVSVQEAVAILKGKGQKSFETLSRNIIPVRLLCSLDSLEREMTDTQKARVVRQLRG